MTSMAEHSEWTASGRNTSCELLAGTNVNQHSGKRSMHGRTQSEGWRTLTLLAGCSSTGRAVETEETTEEVPLGAGNQIIGP